MWKEVVILQAIVIVVGGGIASRGQESTRSQVDSAIAYAEFMKLAPDQRSARFAALSPENKAMIMRAHAGRWLDENRSRLTKDQVALVERTIKFVTPTLYRTPNDPKLLEQNKELESELKCRVRQSDPKRGVRTKSLASTCGAVAR